MLACPSRSNNRKMECGLFLHLPCRGRLMMPHGFFKHSGTRSVWPYCISYSRRKKTIPRFVAGSRLSNLALPRFCNCGVLQTRFFCCYACVLWSGKKIISHWVQPIRSLYCATNHILFSVLAEQRCFHDRARLLSYDQDALICLYFWDQHFLLLLCRRCCTTLQLLSITAMAAQIPISYWMYWLKLRLGFGTCLCFSFGFCY